jgi:hypothetical protein
MQTSSPLLLSVLRSAAGLHESHWRVQHLPILQDALIGVAGRGYWRCLVLVEARYFGTVVDFLQQGGLDDLYRAGARAKVEVCGCHECPVVALGPVEPRSSPCPACGQPVFPLGGGGPQTTVGLLVGWERKGVTVN